MKKNLVLGIFTEEIPSLYKNKANKTEIHKDKGFNPYFKVNTSSSFKNVM